MHRRERQVREHARPDDDDLRDADLPASLHPAHSKSYARPSARWILPLAIPILSLILVALLLSGCEIGIALGLPRNDECRDVETSPGDPISKECLDTIGQTTAAP
jgi:hypothetical protein